MYARNNMGEIYYSMSVCILIVIAGLCRTNLDFNGSTQVLIHF